MSSSRQPRGSGLLAATVAVFLLLGAIAGLPAAAASGSAATLEDDGLLNETLSGTTETVNSTVDATTTVVTGTTETTGETLDTATGGATDGVTDGVSGTTNGTTTVTETTAGGTTETVDATGTTTAATTDATTDAVSATAQGDLAGATDSVGGATTEVGLFTTDRTTSLVEMTATTTTTLTDSTTGTVAALTGTVDATSSTLTTAVESGPVQEVDAGTEPVQELDAGTSDDTTTQERAARIDGVTGDDTTVAGIGSDGTADDGTGDDGSAAIDGSTDGAAAVADSGGLLTTLAGLGDLPVSEDAATGGLLGGLLVGAAGIAVRQGSMAGGTGAGTTALRTATASAAAGDGTLPRLVRMLAPFRYSRYDDSDPLELDARRNVYEAISDQPGEPITAVSDRADVNLSTARHHVKVLRDEGLVATARVRNCERFYPAGTDDLELAAAMADECTADILDALVRLEPASVSGIAEEVDRSPSTVTHHLQKLEDDDLVVRERNGRSVENRLSDPARAALDPETERRRHAAERRLDAEAEAASGTHAD